MSSQPHNLRPTPNPPQHLDGLLILDKPAGVSSAGYLNRLKRLLPKKTKLGHAGTLDPFATGVLLALVGKATKRCEQLMGQPKTYLCTVKLGATTPTLDPDSPETASEPINPPTPDQIQSALTNLSGTPHSAPPTSPPTAPDAAPPTAADPAAGHTVLQLPPAFSALKVAGRRAYDLARSGKPVELSPRPVTVYSITLRHYAYPLVDVELTVGRGYYVRSFARDLAGLLGTAGYLTALRRTRVGPYRVEDALTQDELTKDPFLTRLRQI